MKRCIIHRFCITHQVLQCSKTASRWGPIWPKIALDGPRKTQGGSKMAQGGPKMAQDGLKMAPRWPQDGPKMAPKMVSKIKRHCRLIFEAMLKPFWRPQNGPKMAPRWPQDGPTMAPKRPQEGPNKVQQTSRLTPQSLKTLRKIHILAYPMHLDSKMAPRWPQAGRAKTIKLPRRNAHFGLSSAS